MLLMGLFFLLLVTYLGGIINTSAAVKVILLGLLLLPVACFDYKYGLIFNRWNMLLFLIGLFRVESYSAEQFVFTVLAGAGSLLVLRFLSRGGIGWGDIKLLFALSTWLDWQQMLSTLVLAFWLGGAYGAWRLLYRKCQVGTVVSFGPFLSVAAWVVVAWWSNLQVILEAWLYG